MLAQDGIVWDNTGHYGCQRETHPQTRGKTGRNARFWSKSSEKSGQRVCKPGSVHFSEEKAVIIHLGCPLPNTSCNLPGRRPGNGAICRLYLVLLPTGFTLPCPLPATRCALTAPFHPYLPHKIWGRRFAFCGTFPGVTSAGRYPAPCFRGARTFLPRRLSKQDAKAITRPSDRKLK